eukprot:5899732-Amphidinium_carterae.1
MHREHFTVLISLPCSKQCRFVLGGSDIAKSSLPSKYIHTLSGSVTQYHADVVQVCHEVHDTFRHNNIR